MNSNTPAIISSVAAVASLVILPVSAAAAGLTVSVIGVLAILSLDYGRPIPSLSPAADVIPFGPVSRVPAGLRVAA